MRTALVVIVAIAGLISSASAEPTGPVKLTAEQMDQITAGFMVVGNFATAEAAANATGRHTLTSADTLAQVEQGRSSTSALPGEVGSRPDTVEQCRQCRGQCHRQRQ
jgi:hypothetical protein